MNVPLAAPEAGMAFSTLNVQKLSSKNSKPVKIVNHQKIDLIVSNLIIPGHIPHM